MKLKPAHLALLTTSICSVAYAAFTIPWSTLDGGGGKSTGTAPGGTMLTVQGSVGQFDASAGGAGGGTFLLNGGYWAQVVAPSAPSLPALTIIPQANGSATLQWQANATGWQLQTSSTLSGWSNVGSVIAGAGSQTISPTPSKPKAFYRLVLP